MYHIGSISCYLNASFEVFLAGLVAIFVLYHNIILLLNSIILHKIAVVIMILLDKNLTFYGIIPTKLCKTITIITFQR